MTNFALIFLIIYGVLKIIAGIYGASQHGKPQGEYHGSVEVVEALIGVIFILIAFEVI